MYLWDRKILRNLNYPLFISVIIICLIGIIGIYSSTYRNENSHYFYLRQIFFVLLGLVGVFLILQINYYHLKSFAYPFYILSTVFLIFLFFLGKKVDGANRWLNLGFFSFQPSEITKLSIIILLAKLLEEKINPLQKIQLFSFPFVFLLGLVLLPVGLIVIQPDLGTALVFFFIFLSMLFWAGFEIIYLLGFTLIPFFSIFLGYYFLTVFFKSSFKASQFLNLFIFGLFFFILYIVLYYSKINRKERWFIFLGNLFTSIFSPLLWSFLKEYQKNRLIIFFNPNMDPLGTGYNVIQSKIAIGSGKIIGKGWLQGTQTQLNFLPAKYTDFIFSSIGEEWGFIGSFFIIFIYFTIIFSCFKIAYKSNDIFGSLLVIGITSYLFFHIVVNIGMICGIVPVTGIPLPWLSYGGTSMVINLLAIGLVLNVGIKSRVF